MKYVITGSLGHISKPIAQSLVKAGHEVVVITSSKDRVKDIESLGAKAAVGSLEDSNVVNEAFTGATAVYLMIPPNFAVTDWRGYQNKIGNVFVEAIKKNGIKFAVLLSSIGAHLGEGSGPIDGLYDLEKALTTVDGLNVKNLRPSYFYYNFFAQIPMIKTANIMGGNFGSTDEKMVLTDTGDIADAAVEELLSLDFKGHSVRYISSDERHPNEIASVLGTAIGNPGLPWVSFTDEQTLNGMLQAGLSSAIANGYTTMGKAIRDGKLQEDYWKNKPSKSGKVKLEDFARIFAAAYQS